jgi:hypothetical protein
MLAGLLDGLLLDPVKHALRGEPRMDDAWILLFVGCVALLIWAMKNRAKGKENQRARLDGEETCRHLYCGSRHPRREMMLVYEDGRDHPPVLMCPRCFRAVGHQYASETPR